MQLYEVAHTSILAFAGRGSKAPGQLLYEEVRALSRTLGRRSRPAPTLPWLANLTHHLSPRPSTLTTPPHTSQEFFNQDYIQQSKGWKDIYMDFVTNAQAANPTTECSNIRTLSLAVAGPVENNTVTFTSIKPAWTIDGGVGWGKLAECYFCPSLK